MLDFGRNTLFLAKSTTHINGWFAASNIISDYDTMGHNCLVLAGDEMGLLVGSKHYVSYDSVPKIITDNLFRVDVIVVEVAKNSHYLLERLNDMTDLPIIFIGSKMEDFDIKKFDYVYELYSKRIDTELPIRKYDIVHYVKDVLNDWEMSMPEYKKLYIRNEKINQLFKKD